MDFRKLLLLSQHLRQFIQQQLVDILPRNRLMLPDQIDDQIAVITVVETAIADVLRLFTGHRRHANTACSSAEQGYKPRLLKMTIMRECLGDTALLHEPE